MKLLSILGILIAALGVFIVFNGVILHSQGTVSLGPIHSTVQERHTLPPVVGWVVISGGVLLAIAGWHMRRMKR
jgi:hypothetical protein